jgi:hypothetical protein
MGFLKVMTTRANLLLVLDEYNALRYIDNAMRYNRWWVIVMKTGSRYTPAGRFSK